MQNKSSNTCIHLACTRKLEQVSLLLCAAEGHIKRDTWLLVKTEDPGVQAFFCQPLQASLGWYHPASHDIREYFSCSPYKIYWLLEKKIVVHITTFQLLGFSWCKFNKNKKVEIWAQGKLFQAYVRELYKLTILKIKDLYQCVPFFLSKESTWITEIQYDINIHCVFPALKRKLHKIARNKSLGFRFLWG